MSWVWYVTRVFIDKRWLSLTEWCNCALCGDVLSCCQMRWASPGGAPWQGVNDHYDPPWNLKMMTSYVLRSPGTDRSLCGYQIRFEAKMETVAEVKTHDALWNRSGYCARAQRVTTVHTFVDCIYLIQIQISSEDMSSRAVSSYGAPAAPNPPIEYCFYAEKSHIFILRATYSKSTY